MAWSRPIDKVNFEYAANLLDARLIDHVTKIKIRIFNGSGSFLAIKREKWTFPKAKKNF